MTRSSYLKYLLFAITAFIAAIAYIGIRYQTTPINELIQFHNYPSTFVKKADGLSLNIHGKLDSQVEITRYRINHKPWIEPRTGSPRLKEQEFVLELMADSLSSGNNELDIEIASFLGQRRTTSLILNYDTSEQTFPFIKHWQSSSLESQDGQWQTINREGELWVRPIPGTEGYDRLLLVSAAFKGGRRVETTVTFVESVKNKKLFGFGIIPLWGGHTDSTSRSPRRGWKYGLGWYYSKEQGIGIEFADKVDNGKTIATSKYADFDPQAGAKYQITMDSQQVIDDDGQHLSYLQTLEWREKDTESKPIVIQLNDNREQPLEDLNYAVALVAHRTQVEFDSVIVTSLPPVIKGELESTALNLASER